eukprot:scaffold291_cov168-Amphora_coffeaeformis.AAC.11
MNLCVCLCARLWDSQARETKNQDDGGLMYDARSMASLCPQSVYDSDLFEKNAEKTEKHSIWHFAFSLKPPVWVLRGDVGYFPRPSFKEFGMAAISHIKRHSQPALGKLLGAILPFYSCRDGEKRISLAAFSLDHHVSG